MVMFTFLIICGPIAMRFSQNNDAWSVNFVLNSWFTAIAATLLPLVMRWLSMSIAVVADLQQK